MPSPHESPLCWSCQEVVPDFSRDRVWITSEIFLPVCKTCWQAMGIADRLAAARQFAAIYDLDGDRAASRNAIDTFIAALNNHVGLRQMLDSHGSSN